MKVMTVQTQDKKNGKIENTPSKTLVFELSAESVIKMEAEYGRKIPVDFLSLLEETAFETLYDWFKNNGAPEEVLAMIDRIEILNRQVVTLNFGGKLAELEYADLLPAIADVSKLIADFGGSFFSEYRNPEPRKSTITWGPRSSVPSNIEHLNG